MAWKLYLDVNRLFSFSLSFTYHFILRTFRFPFDRFCHPNKKARDEKNKTINLCSHIASLKQLPNVSFSSGWYRTGEISIHFIVHNITMACNSIFYKFPRLSLGSYLINVAICFIISNNNFYRPLCVHGVFEKR